jgi:hypothetical protein
MVDFNSDENKIVFRKGETLPVEQLSASQDAA